MLEQNGNRLSWAFLVCLFVGSFLDSLVSATKIPLGSKLSVSDNTFWVSSNGDFAFGFFNASDRPNQYSVGVRFNSASIPAEERAVVWVVGADLVVGNGSYFELNSDGELVLFDSLKKVNVWTSKTYQLLVSVESAAILDNGNFVLMSEGNDVVWQSFDFPSDTLVPGQRFSALRTLRAASTGPVSSYYSLFMNGSGQLHLRWDSIVDYWTSPSPAGSNHTAILTPAGALEIRDRDSNPVWSTFGDDHGDTVRLRFLRLDIDGNLRLYSWSEVNRGWKPVWRAVGNQCHVFGTCGKRGVCVYNEFGSSDCECPFGRVNGSVPGCLIPFPQRCRSGYYMLNYRHMSLYSMYPPSSDSDEGSVSGLGSKECETLCLEDPLCTAATFAGDGTGRCSVKKTQYVSGYADPSLRSVSFVKRCLDPVAVNPYPRPGRPGSTRPELEFCFPCLMGAVSGAAVLFVAVQLAVVLFIYRRGRRSLMNRAVSGFAGPNSNGLIVLSFSEIKDVTGNFENRIGSTTFKGVIPPNRPVAVKEIASGLENRRFRVAAAKIGAIHHKSLARLEGYCCEPGRRFLIHEYAENGSVRRYLEDPKLSKKLNWGKRVGICLGMARAVCYLHTGCREFVGHGNLKCENVLLDESLDPKVTGFGLDRFEASRGSSAERDVEDFGRAVLVVVTGCNDPEDISDWTYKEWVEGNAANVVDKRIAGSVGPEELDRVLRIAFWCLQSDERMRPSMREVVKVLEGTLSVDPPPPPFAGSTRAEDDGEFSEAGSEPDSRRF